MDRSLRLLIVEDSAADADMLLLALRRSGFEVTHEVVDTAPAMRAALEGKDWDVITSDHSMPHFSAPIAMALAKELRPDVPFIIVSGEINLNLAVSLMRQGAWDYVQKLELVHLVPAIERSLHEVHVRHEQQRAEQALVRMVPEIERSLREVEAHHEREWTVQALEDSETRYRRLFEAAQDGILILDAGTGRILDVNPFLIDMLGYPKEQFQGKQLWEIGVFKDIGASKAAFTELQATGYIRYENLPLQASDGRVLAAEFVSNVYDVDDTQVIQCNIRDITERKRAQTDLHELNAVLEQRVRQRTAQLESLIEELETFNYSVSHDLRAPLRHIDGFAEHLQEDYAGKLDEGGVRLIQRIRVSVQNMNTLINALLELARISRQDIHGQLVDLSALAWQIAADLQASWPTRLVECVFAEGVTATGDAPLLRIVLENLLANAWKFTSRRTAARIEFGTAAQVDGTVAYFVRDNGAGFDMTHAGQLFTAFRRLHSNKEFPGTGIGLATVRRIVNRHHGRVWAQSAVDQGTTVYFTLS